MNNYLLLARGDSLETARVLAVSADPEIVGLFIHTLVEEPGEAGDQHADPEQHEPLRLVERGEE